ncbi:proline and serine-rich protein 3 [Salminus brasiliensis]|uniref:proline and serine-rich protein 3 n=1 Tax=Salminus brasiliensis TaxID=930266 RepID=UPI003B82E552
MKSSDPVFSRHNPFPPEPHLARAHYNPSRSKKLTKQQKKLALSPVRFEQLASSSEPPPKTSASLSQEDQRFLKGSHRVVLCPPPSVKEPQIFSESWPYADPTSSPASVAASSWAEPQTSRPEHTEPGRTSVLEKYIERFRYGRPQSREERQSMVTTGVDEPPLWVMSSSSPKPSSSTPTQSSKGSLRGQFDRRNNGTGGMRSPAEQSLPITSLSPTRGLLDLSALDLSDSSHCEPGEPEILQLQERACRLLQKSENSLSSGSSGIPISSEGLGCTDFSSPVSVEEPVRRPIVPSLMDTTNLLSTPSVSGGGPFPASSALGTRGSHTRPEDDILFQWRLRRKMEQARQWSQTSSHSSSFHQPLLSRLAQQPSPVSADSPQTAVLSFTPAPVESICSVSIPAASPAYQPAPDDSVTSSRSAPLPQPAGERATLDNEGLCNLPNTHPKVLRNPLDTMEPGSKHQTLSSPSQQPSERTEGERRVCIRREDVQAKGRPVVERGVSKAATSSRRKKSDRHVGAGDGIKRNQHLARASDGHGKGQERVSCRTKDSRRENRGHSGDRGSAGDHAPPPSSIHNTLGQVVSEVLFPDTDSPSLPRTPCSSDSSRFTPVAPPQSPSPPPRSVPQPSELIGQLMQEAQDSDGLEFEDDPLLVVLRQQRKWVKDQLSEVDAMLDDLNEDGYLL